MFHSWWGTTLDADWLPHVHYNFICRDRGGLFQARRDKGAAPLAGCGQPLSPIGVGAPPAAARIIKNDRATRAKFLEWCANVLCAFFGYNQSAGLRCRSAWDVLHGIGGCGLSCDAVVELKFCFTQLRELFPQKQV